MSSIDKLKNIQQQGKKAEQFQQWAHKDQFEKDEEGHLIFDENEKPKDNAEDFEMFEFVPASFSKDLYKFSTEYIAEFDKNNDGKLNLNEFQNLAEENDLLYEKLSGVDGEKDVSPKELASFLQFADWDEDAQEYDGKLNYFMTQAILDANPNTIDKIINETEGFYNYFYKDKPDDDLNN